MPYSVEFCKKCKSLMVPVKKGRTTMMRCRKCGYFYKQPAKDLKIVEKIQKPKGVVILEKDDVPLPTTDVFCPKCEHTKAYYWLQQTRAADEPPTQFFRCVKCNHVWREYK